MTKKTIIYVWLFLLMIINGNLVFGQSSISINRNNSTIRAVLYELEKQTGYSVGFDEKVLNANKKISLNVSDISIEGVLEIVLKDTGCAFSIIDKHIIISKQEETISQKRTIKGQVFEENGDPLVGANVAIEGTSKGTITDLSGNFTIEVVGGNESLIISYIGFGKQRIAIGQSDSYTITLQQDMNTLDEVVVVGYNTIRRKDITTAVSIVSTEDLAERPIVSAAQALQGKAAGVQVVQNSGEPGGGLSVRVRGMTSIEAGNDPLYVVDGIPMSNINNLNPNDIESMQILKDASSAAIYGARAANGVVVVTTKRGQENVNAVTLNTYSGFSKLGNRINALNTEEYKDYIKDLNKFGGTNYNIPDAERRYTNWTDEFFGTGVNQNYQLSLSSGTERTKYYVSLGYVDEQGIVEKANYHRYNFRTNLDHQQTDWLKISLNLGYSNSEGSYVNQNRSSMRAGSILSVINTPPYMQIWDENNPGQYDEFAYGSRILHPIAANAIDQKYKESHLVGSINLDFSLTRKIKYKLHFGIDEINGKWHSYLDPISNSDGRTTKGSVYESVSKNFEWLWENIVSYETSIDNKHNVSLLGGATLQHAYAERLNADGYDMFGTIKYLSGANIINKWGVNSEFSEWTLASYLGRVSYDYESKYLFSVNVRADGSSKFTPGYKWGVFPSMSAGWRISSEPFMESLSSVISDLKLRGGWGLNGNQAGISNYAWVATYLMERVEPTSDNPLPGMSFQQSSPGNKELTWETTSQTNVGIDLSMFRSRINFTFDLYYKYTRDMLISVTFPSGTPGLTRGIQRNDGEMMNKGMEIALSTKNFVSDFKWNTDFNISFNKNKLMKTGVTPVRYLAETYHTGQYIIMLKEGYPLGSFYGYVSEGVDPETGNIIYKDINGNGMIDPEDRTVIGNAQPKFVFGITNSFSYKGFDLSLFFQGSYGNDIFNASKIDMTRMMDFTNQTTDVLRRWKRPGMITDIPKPGEIANSWNSSRFVEDGSYLRLKSITLSYNFNTKRGVLKSLGIDKLQPYVTGQNLLTLTNYTGYDPEVNAYGNSSTSLGVDYGTYPQSKAVIFGLNVQF